MRQYLAILTAATLFAACGGDKTTTGDDDDDTTATGDDDDDTACNVQVVSQFPADGATDAYFKTDVRFQLSEEDASATITVKDAGGAEVSGDSMAMGNLVIWQGDDLQPSTDYTATLSYACGDATAAWSTSATGAPTGGGVVDTVYDLDLASGSWVLPSPEVGALLATQLDVELLFMPLSADTEIVMRGALGTGADAQDLCSPTLEFPAATFEDPFFQIASPLLTLNVAGYSIDVQDLDLQGSFRPDASGIDGASLQGVIDTRPLVDVLAPGGADDSVCVLVSTFGVSCVDCGNGENYCLEVWVDSIEAGAVNADPLVAITEADIAANPDCAAATN
jgi:hypothetical protein